MTCMGRWVAVAALVMVAACGNDDSGQNGTGGAAGSDASVGGAGAGGSGGVGGTSAGGQPGGGSGGSGTGGTSASGGTGSGGTATGGTAGATGGVGGTAGATGGVGGTAGATGGVGGTAGATGGVAGMDGGGAAGSGGVAGAATGGSGGTAAGGTDGGSDASTCPQVLTPPTVQSDDCYAGTWQSATDCPAGCSLPTSAVLCVKSGLPTPSTGCVLVKGSYLYCCPPSCVRRATYDNMCTLYSKPPVAHSCHPNTTPGMSGCLPLGMSATPDIFCCPS